MYIEKLLCKRYKKDKEQMIDIQKASFELLLPVENVKNLLENGVLKSLKIKDISEYIKKVEGL